VSILRTGGRRRLTTRLLCRRKNLSGLRHLRLHLYLFLFTLSLSLSLSASIRLRHITHAANQIECSAATGISQGTVEARKSDRASAFSATNTIYIAQELSLEYEIAFNDVSTERRWSDF
jgi:hypothetical protein